MARLSPNAAEVVLVRHGETDWNVQRRLQGQDLSVPGINESGRLQAQAVRSYRAVPQSPSHHASRPHDACTLDLALMAVRAQLAKHFVEDRELGSRLDAVYSSDLARAAETAQIIAQALGLPEGRSEALRERHLGLLQGLTTEEAAVLQPAALEALRYAPDDVPIPGGGESVTGMQERAVRAVEEIAARHPGARLLGLERRAMG